MAGIDARLYSRAESQMPVESLAGAGTAGQESYTPPERNIPVNTVGAGEATLIGEQVRQGASLVEPSRLASLGATFLQMPIADAYAWLTKPEHDPDTKDSPTFNDVLQRIPFELTEAEYTKLKEAQNYGDRQWYVDRFTEKRETARVAGEYPLQHFAASVGLDPTTYVSAFGAFKVGQLAQAANVSTTGARAVAGLTSGIIETSVNYTGAQANPMSTGQMFLTALAATAGGATMVRGGKIVQVDPDLPVREMQASLGKPHMRMVSPAEYADEVVPASAEVVQEVPVTLDKTLRGAAPRYGYKDSNFILQFASDVERAAYIVAGAGKSKQHDAYLQYLKDATGLQEAEIIALGQHVRSTVKEQAKTATGDTLSVGRLFSGDVRTTRVVTTPATPGSIVTRKVRDAIWEEVPKPLREGASAEPHMRMVSPAEYIDEVVPTVYHRTTAQFPVEEGLRKEPNRLGVSFAGEAGYYFSHTFDEPTSAIFGQRVLAADVTLKNPAVPTKVDARTVRVQVPISRQEIQDIYKPAQWHNGTPVSGGFIKEGDKFTRWINPEVLQDADVTLLKKRGYDGIEWRGEEGITMPPQTVLFDASQAKNLRQVTEASQGTQRVKIKDAVWEEIPKPLREGASAEPQEIAQAVEKVVDTQVKSWGKSFGETMAWNVHKSLKKLSSVGDEVADLFVDNNAKYGITSVESEKAAIMRDLGTHQWAYEDAFRAELAKRGHGTWRQLVASGETRQASATLEEQLKREMLRRDTLFRQGRTITHDGVDPSVKNLADMLDNAFGASLDEMKAAKVFGAENLQRRPGYFTRVHSADRMEGVLDELKAAGMSEEKARRQLVNMYRGSVRRANPTMDEQVADDIAGALVDRTLRKGRLEDSPRNTMYGSDTAAEVRDILKGAGISGDRLQRALDAMVGVVDEQGKAGYLKHRIDLDYTASMVVNGRTVSVADMIEGNMNTLLDTYLHGVAAKTAFARKGITKQGDLLKVRNKYIQGATDKEAARDLFDNMVAHLEGRPTGEKMTEFMRNAGMYSRMITLGSSAVWQATEYATMAHRYGYLKTFKYAMAEMPLFKNLMETAAHDKVLSRELKDVLTNQADQNIRLRPFIGKFEDNFAMPKDSQLATAARQGAQLVPYVNGMKLIHGHQARVQANLIMEVMRKASTGDVKARDLLKGYGIEQHGMDKLSNAMKAHGTSVDKWDAATWRAVRPALTKMVDEGVLHARLGDMPAYAMFSQTGKFIFQYRSFVLSAHNKILSGTASRHGLGAVALMSMYQFPLAMMATQANEVLTGRKPLATDALIVKSIGQMGSLGGLTEIWNWLSGTKREVGAPGLIPFDRTIRAASSASSAMFGEGSAGQAAKDSMALAPILGVAPGFKMLGSLLVPKE